MTGHVYLVGAGPGDPGLMTVEGMRLLRSAEVVVYDALADHSLLDECKGALLIDVGKRSCNHTKTQDQINQILADYGSKGKSVVRLKGGDPFLFGRGAEEAAFLRKAGVGVTVVPGVSSSIAVPELAGIPVTHRDHSSSVTIVTGHEKNEKNAPVDWKALANVHGTIVVLMGMSNASRISSELIEGGMSPETPVSVTTDGSRAEQRTVVTVLRSLSETIAAEGLKAPGIIVIGGVVSERETLGDLS